MTNRLALLLLCFLAACAAAPMAPETSPPDDTPRDFAASRGPEIWAYNAYWMGDAWRATDLGALQRLLFFDLPVGKDGSLDTRGWPDQWASLRTRAREARVPIDPVVSLLTVEVFSSVFANPAARSRLLSDTLAAARLSGGVHLDVEVMEGVRAADIEAYRAFVADLRRALDQPRKRVLTAFVPAQNILYGPGELALLDAVVAQGYDLHWQTSPTAGPPAALEGPSPAAWRAAASNLAALGVPPRKLLFSTPFYGYEWPTVSDERGAATRGQATIITYAPVSSRILPDLRVNALDRSRQHGLKRDAASNAPWYVFRDKEGWRQGWFDDVTSLAPRLDFVQRGDYRGVALFVLGYDGGALLEVMRAKFRAGNAPPGGGGPPAAR